MVMNVSYTEAVDRRKFCRGARKIHMIISRKLNIILQVNIWNETVNKRLFEPCIHTYIFHGSIFVNMVVGFAICLKLECHTNKAAKYTPFLLSDKSDNLQWRTCNGLSDVCA
jgi:hypothetical protein